MAGEELHSGIFFQQVEKPPFISDDFENSENVTIRYFDIRTDRDDHTINACLWQPEGKEPGETKIIVGVHGSNSLYCLSTIGYLFSAMTSRGFAFLGVNMRGGRNSGEGRLEDNFFDSYQDLFATTQLLKHLGYRSIVVLGHSMGSLQATYFCALNHDPMIKGLILASAFANLPLKTRDIIIGNKQHYSELHESAARFVKSGKHDSILPKEMPYLHGKNVPVSAIHFYTYRDTDTSIAVTEKWIQLVPLPVLILQDEGDQIVQPAESWKLMECASSTSSMVRDAEYRLIPNKRGPNPDGHSFTDNFNELGTIIGDWCGETYP